MATSAKGTPQFSRVAAGTAKTADPGASPTVTPQSLLCHRCGGAIEGGPVLRRDVFYCSLECAYEAEPIPGIFLG